MTAMKQGWLCLTPYLLALCARGDNDYLVRELDLNRDGIVDFAITVHLGGDCGGPPCEKWEDLVPLGTAQVLSGPTLRPGAAVAEDTLGSRRWQSAPLRLRADWPPNPGLPRWFYVQGYVGLRVEASDGIHYGWFLLAPRSDGGREEGSLGTVALEPRPGVPLVAGEVPDSLAIIHGGQQVRIGWNALLSGLELESSPSLDAAEWAVVAPGNEGKHDVATTEGRSFYRLASARAEPAPTTLLAGHDASVRELAFLADGSGLVATDGQGARLWNLPDRHINRAFSAGDAEDEVALVAVAPGGAFVAGVSAGRFWSDPVLRVWRPADGTILAQRPFGLTPRGLAVSADGRYVAGLGADSSLTVVDVSNGEMREFPHPTEGLSPPLAFSSDGLRIAAGTHDNLVVIWEIATRRKQLELAAAPGDLTHSLHSLAFSPDNARLVSGGGGGEVRLWRSATVDLKPVLRATPRSSRRLPSLPAGSCSSPAVTTPRRGFGASTTAPDWRYSVMSPARLQRCHLSPSHPTVG